MISVHQVDLFFLDTVSNDRAKFFDNRIINAETFSYVAQDWLTIARNAAQQNYQKYDKAAEVVRGSFTPLICSADGVNPPKWG